VMLLARTVLFFGGLCLAAPDGAILGLSHWTLTAIGVALAAGPIILASRHQPDA
jgi:hypothetical protein